MSDGYTTSVFLGWLADRLEHVYDESPNTDFVQRLRLEAAKAEAREEQLAAVHETYELRPTDSVFMTGQAGYVLHRVGKPGVLPTELRLTPQQAIDLKIILGLADHEKNHHLHQH
jgi:hypothetical protein